MADNAFGLSDVMGAMVSDDGTVDPLIADLVGTEQTPGGEETPEPVPGTGAEEGSSPPEPPAVGAAEQGEPPSGEGPPEAGAEEGAPDEGGAEPPPSQRYAGRFETVDQLEHSYRSLQGEYTRSQQALQDTRRELVSRMEQYEQALGAVVPVLDHIQSEQDPEYAERKQRTNELAQLIEQRLKPIEQRVTDAVSQLEIRQSAAGVEAAVSVFRSQHPDVVDGSDLDLDMAETVTRFSQAWGSQGRTPQYDDPAFLELAYEATIDPFLGVALTNSPMLADTPQGLQYARWQARQLASFSEQQPRTQAPAGAEVPKAGPTKVQRQEAFVETGPGEGTPPPGAPQRTPDEFDEVLGLARASKKSAFGI